MQALDPRARALLTWLRVIGWPSLAERTPAQARRDFRLLTAATSRTPSGVRVRYGSIPGPAGRLPVRWYTPRTGRAPRPLLVWFHGGGFVVGDLFTADGTARTLADRSGAVVLSVGYRLAPEHDCLAAVDDAWAALNWAATHAGELGADPARLVVGGESAGATLSALVAQRARHGGPTLGLQVLVSPATDLALDRLATLPGGAAPLLDRAVLDWFSGHFFAGHDPADPCLSPGRAADVAGVAPALILTADWDLLRDDGEAYAERLAASGVAVEHVRYPGQIHGFLAMDRIFPAARHALDRVATAVAAVAPSAIPAVPDTAPSRAARWDGLAGEQATLTRELWLRTPIYGAVTAAATLFEHHTQRLARLTRSLASIMTDPADGEPSAPTLGGPR
jgi:acetyl esterase